MRDQRQPDDTMRWVRRGSVLAVLLIGWVFILLTNHFHITPSVVFVCLGYLAAVAAIYTLYRMGATAVTHTNEDDDAMSWVKPLGALDELEREKRSLLKAIKEAEFDHQMGKLSKADADAMIAIYRARAIEVIKELDVQSSTGGKAGTVRERILREARARLEVEKKSNSAPAKKNDKKGNQNGTDKQKARADKLADAVHGAKGAKPAAAADTKADDADDKRGDVNADGDADESKLADNSADDRVESKADDKVESKSDDGSTDERVESKSNDADKIASNADELPVEPTSTVKSESKEAAR